MGLILAAIGKTTETEAESHIRKYSERIRRYLKFDFLVIPEPRLSASVPLGDVRKAEENAIRQQLKPGDTLILLDENGTQYSSEEFAAYLQKKLAHSQGRVIFCIGGAHGFSPELLAAHDKISLSKLTFTHQMVRSIAIEQLYRALTILRGEKYHH